MHTELMAFHFIVTRAKMGSAAVLSKVRGASKTMPYPQPEGVLGETMHKNGKALGDESMFGTYILNVSMNSIC